MVHVFNDAFFTCACKDILDRLRLRDSVEVRRPVDSCELKNNTESNLGILFDCSFDIESLEPYIRYDQDNGSVLSYHLARDLMQVTVVLRKVIYPCPHEVFREKHREFRGW